MNHLIEPTKVSVIVPVRNDAQRLKRCLESLNRLSVRPEIVVVDNGSIDGSADLARSLGAKTLLYPQLKVGALRNRGVSVCHGDILAFVDSDHEVPEDWLEMGVAVLNEGKGIVACGSPCLPPLPGTWVQKVWSIHRLRGPARVETVDWLGSGNLLVLRSAFDAIGGFREELIAAEDVDLCHRLIANSGRIVLDKRIRNIHHGEPKTLREFMRKEYWRGSSGLRAWASQGFPLRDLPSFIWPVWHLLVGLFFVVMTTWVVFRPNWVKMGIWAVAIVLLTIPSILLSAKTCLKERRLSYVLHLALLYFLYAMTRAAALFKGI